MFAVRRSAALPVAFLLALAACGGGGEDPTAPVPARPDGKSEQSTASDRPPEQAGEAHGWIRREIAAWNQGAADRVRILSGGSVKPDNARELLSQPDVDGALVGGASLVPASFLAIAKGAKHSI